MKQHLTQLRPATAALFAALVFPTAPVFAQDTLTPPAPPVIAAPPPVVTAPPPVTAAPAPAPAPVATAPAPAPTARTTTTRTTTTRTTTRSPAPARTASRAPAPAARAPAPAPIPAAAPAPAPIAEAPVAAAPLPPVEAAPAPVTPVDAAPVENQAPAARNLLPWLIGGLVALALLAAFFLFRRRRTDEIYEGSYDEPAPAREPAFVAPIEVAPVAAVPFVAPSHDLIPASVARPQPVADEPVAAIPPPEEINVAEADHADVEALAASSHPVSGRPWLEFLMRPMRAGTNRDNTIVQFELTVGNTGDAPARDVRISTWVVAAGEGSDYERSLIEPPADASVEQMSIDAGEGATVEAKIGLANEGHDESVLPVVVADARYTLPDGSEGRTHASFAVGVPAAESGELQPFLTDRSSGLRENVEARLHGEPERV